MSMKIIYGITKSNFGGAQRYVFDLATEAKKKGHEVAVMCGGDGILAEKLREASVRVISIPNMKREISLLDELRSFHFIFRTLMEERPALFHTNSSKIGGIGNLAARLAGVKKIIFTAHGWAFNEPRPWRQKILIKFFTWMTIVLAHKTICVSEKTREDVSWIFIKNKLTVIHNGIKEFELKKRETTGFTVGTIAELHRVKGLDILLLAWSEFVKKRGGKLVIIGEGDERENLENKANLLDILDSVEFKGRVENAREHLKDFDIFVLSSRSEALPYVLLEAGMAELPVIATRVGGIPEIVESGTTGILVTPENHQEILSSLILLYEDESLRKRLGSELKKKILEDFSKEKVVEKTFNLYLPDSRTL